MSDLLAKGIAATIFGMLLMVIAILVVTSKPTGASRTVVAEFDDAFPLIEGMYVRVDGAIAGSVGKIDVNDRGNAEVKLNLNDSIEAPSDDATAAIRQQDTTGDSYVAFDPGDSGTPLPDDKISCVDASSCDQTLVAPRLDDLLNAFGPAERSGIQLMLVELSRTLDRRGADLNDAALSLKPAIEAADQAFSEVSKQNEALKQLVTSAEKVTGQAADRSKELARLIDGLAITTNVTAAESTSLGAALDKLPETTTQLNSTLASLTNSANAATPLAQEVAAGAPLLASALDKTPGFLDNTEAFLNDTGPVLDLSRKLLKAAKPTLEVGKERIVTGPFDLTGATADLLNAVLGGEDAFPALFGDDSYGVGEGTLGKRGFGAVAVEPGNLPGYPDSHADRNWLRVSAVINCEVFGVPVEPGCLANLLAPRGSSSSGASATDRAKQATGARGGNGSSDAKPDVNKPGLGGNLPNVPDLPNLDLEEIGKAGEGLRGLTDKALGKKQRKRDKGKRKGSRADSLDDLLDYLLSNG